MRSTLTQTLASYLRCGIIHAATNGPQALRRLIGPFFVDPDSVNISFNDADLQPLVESVVAATLEKLEARRRRIGERLAYSEAEAAALLSVRPHVLRDARLRGEVSGCRVGKGIRYERDELLRFLRRQRNV